MHLRSKSQGDLGDVAGKLYNSLLGEISVAIGSLVQYLENRGIDRFRVATIKRSAFLE